MIRESLRIVLRININELALKLVTIGPEVDDIFEKHIKSEPERMILLMMYALIHAVGAHASRDPDIAIEHFIRALPQARLILDEIMPTWVEDSQTEQQIH